MTVSDLVELRETRSLLVVKTVGRGALGVIGFITGNIGGSPLVISMGLLAGVSAVSCMARAFDASEVLARYDHR
jgi:hypothetical protein